MAVPTRSETLSNFVSATADTRRPGLVDNFFTAIPLLVRLRAKNKVRGDGGKYISFRHIYGGLPSSSYGRGSTFSTETTEFATEMNLNWKFNYTAINLNAIDVELNEGQELFNLVDAALEAGEMSLMDELADQLYADGTGNSSLDIDGLAIAVSRTGSYGGITRGADAVGASIRAAVEDTTGGTLQLQTINTHFGSCIVAGKAPDLLPTTQTLYNRIWERSQPSEQNAPSKMRDIGFQTVRFNGADVVVDTKVPSGFLYLLRTDSFEFVTHKKWDFVFRGFMEPAHQQVKIGQLIVWSNLLCRSPRLNGVASGLT